MRRMEFESDADGIITFLPLLRWGVSVVQGKTVGLAIEYYANAEDAAAERTTRLQLHLEAANAKDLARAIAARGDMILGAGGG